MLVPAALMTPPAPLTVPSEIVEVAEPVSVRLVPLIATAPVLTMFCPVASIVPVEPAKTVISFVRESVPEPAGAKVPPWNCKALPPVTRASEALIIVVMVEGPEGRNEVSNIVWPR